MRKGETRNASTEYVINNGGTIVDAVSSQPWSGDAQVHVSIVNWIKGPYDGPKTLWLQEGETKMQVDRISGALSTNIDLIDARALAVNRKPKRFFQGQTPQNSAFVLTPDEAARLVAADPRSADVIHPYLIGK